MTRPEAISVLRCQFVSPTPWGPSQCALPEGHEERHAFSPSEGPLHQCDGARFCGYCMTVQQESEAASRRATEEPS